MAVVRVPAEEFQQRRQRLLQLLAKRAPQGAIAIIPAAPEVTRSRDTEYPFRQDSDFYYLTGFNEPNAVLVLAPDNDHPVQLFCQPKDPQAEVWHGRRLGVETAIERLGVDAAWSMDELDKRMPRLLNQVPNLFYSQGTYAEMDTRVWGWFEVLRSAPKKGYVVPQSIHDLRPVVHGMRLLKSESELAVMREAANITVQAHKNAMRFCQAGRFEYQVAAAIHHDFAQAGAHHPAYGTICGGGDNACILHYTDNLDELDDGDLLLIDAGAEYQGYAADITRTFPVNGRFSEPQKALYEIVLAAQLAALKEVKPGGSLPAAQEAAAKVITKGLLELGILQGKYSDHWQRASYRQYFIHGLGHWLGLDVHDVGPYNDPNSGKPLLLKAGMVLTIEPGIYIPNDADVDPRWRGIGIRIEDDVVVTASGHDNLTEAVPKTVADIEAWMAGA